MCMRFTLKIMFIFCRCIVRLVCEVLSPDEREMYCQDQVGEDILILLLMMNKQAPSS